MSVLIEQFDLVWALAELHLAALVEQDFHWAPAGLTWGVHRGADGAWTPDFADSEPDPVPVPTIAWLTWHIDWWWTTTLATVTGDTVPDRTDVQWPGSGAAAVARVRELAGQWRPVLTRADPQLASTAAWLNMELMKNVAEIGQLRLLRAAG